MENDLSIKKQHLSLRSPSAACKIHQTLAALKDFAAQADLNFSKLFNGY